MIRIRAATAIAAGAVLAAGVIVIPRAHAAGESISLTRVSVTGNQIEFGVCLSPGDALPARLTGAYTVSRPGASPSTVEWSDPEPTAVLVDVTPCPANAWVLALNGLVPDATYTIDVSIVLTPMVEQENADDAFAPTWVADPARSTVNLTASLVVTATDPPAQEESGDGESGSSASPNPTSSGRPLPSPSPGSSSTPGVTPVTIADPTTFRPAQLAALSPAQVATIPPGTFGRLPAATVAALTPRQAAALTPAQVAAVLPSRAAALTPTTVRALRPAAVAALRPTAVAVLAPRAVAAMSDAQLRALRPQQVRALTSRQLRALTAAQRALLRR